jgi:hypothetical protein
MKKRILTTAVLAMAVSAAWGQASSPAAPAEAQKSAMDGKKQQAEARPQAQAAASNSAVARKPNPRRFEDARHCLEKSSNTEIIKCAEVYL